MRLLIFDGQGSSPMSTPAPSSSRTTPVPPMNSSSTLAALFVRHAQSALRARLAALSPALVSALDTPATRSVFAAMRAGAIALPTADATLLQNPLVSLPSLYVAQVVRLLEELEARPQVILGGRLEVVGYSSGLLPALLAATSLPSPAAPCMLTPSAQLSLLSAALALFDLTVSLGIHTQLSRTHLLEAGGIALDDPVRETEWSVVVFNITRDALEHRIEAWNAQSSDPLRGIYLTAQTTSACHTVSGLPSTLREFAASLSSSPCSFPAPSFSPSSSVSSKGSFSSDLDARTYHRPASPECVYTPATSPSSSQVSLAPHASPVVVPHTDSCVSNSSTFPLSEISLDEPTTPAMPSTPLPTRNSTPPMTKPLNVFTLFHADISHLRAARDRVLDEFFPTTHTSNDENALTDTPDDTTNHDSDQKYDHDHYNDYAHANDDTTTATASAAVLNALRLTPGYTLCDTNSGRVIPQTLTGRELVTRILDMILLERVEFAAVLERLGEAAGSDEAKSITEFLNIGPGTGLARAAMRALKERVPGACASLTDLSAAPPTSAKARPPTADGPEPIAIVGMAVNFPGARDVDELWHVIEKGINTVEEIPETRFSISPYASPTANPNRKMKTRFGNFLPDGLHASFDNAFFRISPREARALDPQIRVLMRVGLQAMEGAGLVVEDFQGEADGETPGSESETRSEGVIGSEDVGCFVGVATNDYVFNLRNEVGVHYATGTLPAFLAGRLAYALHLSGPSLVLNTACSSSLVAIHQACRALLSGDCKAALAGGVNVVTSPEMYLGLDRAHFLSPTGNCKPWDASADGYCRAEGCGMFVLKRLSDALASADNILGVIRGTEVNQSAAAVSITRPHAPTQAALFRSLLDKSGVRPEDVSVVEAHGTGTQAGDPEELKSLRSVLSPGEGRDRSDDNMLTVTSIKGNTGHAEAASGAASLAKILLMLRHRAIPPQVGLINLNPKIEPLENDFTRINRGDNCIKWTPGKDGKRIALVNNFGAAGSNAVMLVEEAPARCSVLGMAEAKGANDQVLVGFSAETVDALLRMRDSYLACANDVSLVDFAYTATARRKMRPWRMAVAADSAAGLVKALESAKPAHVPQGEPAKKIVFVFSGQGGQHLGMGNQLYRVSRTFRAAVDACHRKLVGWGYPGVLAIIDPEQDEASGLEKGDELVAFQCAIFVLEWALLCLWESWSVKPDVVIGHSLGEYAALVAAGVISCDAALHIVARRARLMIQRCKQGASGMLVVRLATQTVSDTIAKLEGCESLSIACYNGAKDVIVGGPLGQLMTLKSHFESIGSKCISVNVPFAYHTAAMDPILRDLSAFASHFELKAPRIPIVSNVFGKVVQAGDTSMFDAGYFALHCRRPVRFEEGANDLAGSLGSIGALVELGPHPTTLPMLSQVIASSGSASLQSLHKKISARSSLCSSLARLYPFCNGIAWGKVFRELYSSARCIEIPTYPLTETEFWAPYVEQGPSATAIAEPSRPSTRFSFLESWTQRPSSQDGNISEFETPIEHLAEYITGHLVSSFPLCPASVYYELALSAATCTLEHADGSFANEVLTLSDVQFTHALVYDANVPLAIRTTINLHPHGGKHAGTFTVSSVLDGKEQHTHCTGFFQRRPKGSVTSKLQLHHGMVERSKSSLLGGNGAFQHETLRTRTIYDLIFPRVVQYSKLYQVIRTMTLDELKGQGFATIQLSADRISEGFVAQPIFVDALLHAAGFLINSQASNGDAYICSQVDSSKMLYDIDYSVTYEVYCTITSVDEGVILADAWAIEAGASGKVVAHMKRMRFSRLRLNSLNKLLARSKSAEFPARSGLRPLVIKPIERRASFPATIKPRAPFRPTHRANTPSALTSTTMVSGAFDLGFQISKLVADTCCVPLEDVSLSSSIADLGVDSLIWIELIGHLKSIVPGASLEVSQLMLSRTIGDLVCKIANVDQRSVPDVMSFKMPLTRLEESRSSAGTRFAMPPLDDAPALDEIKDILGKILDIAPGDLRDIDSLDTLGLDSLGSIEALHDLQNQFRLSLPQDFFRTYSTIGAVQHYIKNSSKPRYLSRQSSSSMLSDTEPIVKVVGLNRTLLPLQTSESNSNPLFLIHDGSGLSHCYSRIGTLGRSLWGISNPKLLSGEHWEGGVSEMAAHYMAEIKPIITTRGCILGGWSFGGVVAFHMACELIQAGIKVAGVVLIDSPSPFTQTSLPEALIDAVIQAGSHTSSSHDQQTKIIQLARRQMSHSTRALVAYDPQLPVSATQTLSRPNIVMLRCTDPFPLPTIPGYEASGSMPFLEDRSDPRSTVRDWERLVGRSVPVLDIPGHHFEPFQPKNVNVLTEQLHKAVTILEATSGTYCV